MDENLYNGSYGIYNVSDNNSGLVLSSSGDSSEESDNMENTGYSYIDYSDYFERIHGDLLSIQEYFTSSDTEVTNEDLHTDLKYILLILVIFLAITVFRGFHSLIKGL